MSRGFFNPRVHLLLVGAVIGISHPASGQLPNTTCVALQNEINSLSDVDRNLLKQYGAVLRKHWIISPDLVQGCDVRRGIAHYLQSALAGETSQDDLAFMRRERKAVAQVIKQIWASIGTSAAVRPDGALVEEKWGILTHSGIPNEDLTDLVRQSLRKEGTSGALVHFALGRRLPGLDRDIEEILRREQDRATARDRTATTEIYCLAILYCLRGSDVEKPLSALISDPRATATEKGVIQTLRKRIEAKQAVRWKDIEDLAKEP